MFKPGTAIWYNVKDLERTLEFYTEKLGFKILNHNSVMRQARLTTNTEDCFMGFSEAESHSPATTSATFEVENVEQAMQILQEKGVVFNGGVRTIPQLVKLATFKDPDGHDLMLSEKLNRD